MRAALLSSLLASLPAGATQPATQTEQLASIVVDRCVAAQKTLQLSLDDLPANAAQLGPNALKQLRYAVDDYVLAFQASDGIVLFTPKRSCAVTVVNGGGRVFVDAVAAKLKTSGYNVTTSDDKPHPSGGDNRLNTMVVPVGSGRSAAVISSYSDEHTPPERSGIYVSVIAVEKP